MPTRFSSSARCEPSSTRTTSGSPIGAWASLANRCRSSIPSSSTKNQPAKEASTDRPMSTEGRELAHRVARLLVDRSRGEEAVAVLAAWAASGPNDGPGQQLLAEALRLDPGSALAKMAFQRMEGVPGDQALLDQAIATF